MIDFDRICRSVERAVGSPPAFIAALAVVVLWAATGPLFGWSDTWQLVINTGTTIVTFLMVFLIQNAQSRDVLALHTKLDELILVTAAARNQVILAEEIDREELTRLRQGLQ